MIKLSLRMLHCRVGTMLPTCSFAKGILRKSGLFLAVEFLLVLPLCVAVIAEDGDKLLSSTSNPLETTECEYYNGTACLAGDPDCRGTELCNLHEKKISVHARCYVMWTNSSDGKVEVEMKGCFIGDHSCRNQNKCIAREEHNRVTKERPHIYCCCYSNNCNREFSWQPAPERLHKPADSQEDNVVVLVLCPLGALAVVGVVVVLGYYCYRKSKMPPRFHPLPSAVGSDCTSAEPLHTSLPESVSQHTAVSTLCPAPHKPVKLLEVKARGRFGALWMALRDNEYVAVKIFPALDYDSWHVEKEVYGLPQFQHPNILEFIGVEKHGEGVLTEYWLISAYHYRGSLSDYLKKEVVSWSEARRIALTMAQGLCYLHEELPATATEAAKPIIAHRDFKSKNVLLKADLTACIADFGLAIVFYGGQSTGDTRGQVGTRRYMAPEVLEGAISFQTDAILRIDMYACGLVLWELLSRCTGLGCAVQEYKLPFEKEVGYHPTLDEMQECVVVQKCRPAIKKSWLNHPGVEVMVSTMDECWDHDFEARLTAACVVERLSAVSHTDGIVLPDPDGLHTHKNKQPAHGVRGAEDGPLRGVVSDNADQQFLRSANTPGQERQGQCPSYGYGGGAYSKAAQGNNVASVIYGKKLMPAELQSGNVSLSSSGVSIPDKYNANTSSGSSNGSCSSSSNSGGSDSVINHHIALSNSIPRPVATAKPMVLPSINVPLPQPLSPNMTTKLPIGDGRQAPLPTVMVPILNKQQPPQLQQQDLQVTPPVP